MGRSRISIADHYCVCHIASATIPGSRLCNILAKMAEGHQPTKLSLDFLANEDLADLSRLANGEINHQDYIAKLSADQLLRNQVAKAGLLAEEATREALEVRYLAHEAKSRTPSIAAKIDRESERNQRRKMEREASEAVLKAQRARQAEWKAQRERNRKMAADAYQMLAASSNFIEPDIRDIARHFHLNHSAYASRSPTSDILQSLFCGRPLTDDELNHLKQNVPGDLFQVANGQLTLVEYAEAAKARETAAVARRAEAEANNAARIARESDPQHIEMMQMRALYSKYEVTMNEQSLLPQMTKILRQIDTGTRLSREELAWLSTKGRKCFTARVREAYNRLEADFHADQFRSNRDPWSAINASGHYRKCRQSETALKLLDSLVIDSLKNQKIKSAVLTTRGGVMRDLGRRTEAIQMGHKAHEFMEKDYRPCTLLGAVHMERHEFELGREWYKKAQQRGASEDSIDSDLKSIFQQMDQAGREAMKRFLLAEDNDRYRWLNEPTFRGKPLSRNHSGKKNSNRSD